MNSILLIADNEIKNFQRSDKGVFFVHSILVIVWSSVLAANMHQFSFDTGNLWLIFFSVIVSGNFANTAFVSERLNGSLEILLTCGIPRTAILAGKIVYILFMSVIFGSCCYLLAVIETSIAGISPVMVFKSSGAGIIFLTYLTACFMNAACGAWLSVRLANPRLTHFANLLVLGIIVGGHSFLSAFMSPMPWILPVIMTVTGAFFMFMAFIDFAGERVIQPVSM